MAMLESAPQLRPGRFPPTRDPIFCSFRLCRGVHPEVDDGSRCGGTNLILNPKVPSEVRIRDIGQPAKKKYYFENLKMQHQGTAHW